jgi:opacity protein-like surface antigen
MKKIVLTALAGVSLITVPAARAADGFLGNGFYGSLSGGLTSTRDSNWDGFGASGNIGLANGANFAGALGLKVSPNIRTEVELSYRRANLNSVSLDGGGSASLGGHLTTWGLLVNGYYDFMPDSKFNPWLSAGLGMAGHTGTLDSVPSVGFSSTSASDDVFAYQLGGGVDYNLSPQTALFAGYRYLGTTAPSFDGIKASYGAHEFRVGVRQSFN